MSAQARSVDQDLAGGGGDHAGKCSNKGRFACAIRTKKAKKFAAEDLEGDSFQHFRRSILYEKIFNRYHQVGHAVHSGTFSSGKQMPESAPVVALGHDKRKIFGGRIEDHNQSDGNAVP